MTIQRLTPADAGCIYDSHHGHYIVPFVIGYAERSGRPTDPFVGWALATYQRCSHEPDYPNDALIEESELATVWLNDNIAPDEYAFGWNDGDFGLYMLDNEYSDWIDPEEFAQRAKKGDD